MTPFLPRDLSGYTFGRLKVRKASSRRDKQGNVLWLCDCECGGTKYASKVHLRRGQVVSCGCAAAEVKSLNLKRHAEAKSELREALDELRRYKAALAESLDHCEQLYRRIHELEDAKEEQHAAIFRAGDFAIPQEAFD